MKPPRVAQTVSNGPSQEEAGTEHAQCVAAAHGRPRERERVHRQQRKGQDLGPGSRQGQEQADEVAGQQHPVVHLNAAGAVIQLVEDEGRPEGEGLEGKRGRRHEATKTETRSLPNAPH